MDAEERGGGRRRRTEGEGEGEGEGVAEEETNRANEDTRGGGGDAGARVERVGGEKERITRVDARSKCGFDGGRRRRRRGRRALRRNAVHRQSRSSRRNHQVDDGNAVHEHSRRGFAARFREAHGRPDASRRGPPRELAAARLFARRHSRLQPLISTGARVGRSQ